MTNQTKLNKIKETIINKLEDEFDKEFYLEILNDFVETCAEYYVTVYDSNSIRFECKNQTNDLKEYQQRVSSFDNKRRQLHNSIIRNLVHIERFAREYDLEPLYGRLTDDEINNYKLIADSSERRTEVANYCINFVSKLI